MNKPNSLKHILFFLLLFAVFSGLGISLIYPRVVFSPDKKVGDSQSEKIGNQGVDTLNFLTDELSKVSVPAIRSIDSIKTFSQVVLANKPLEIISTDDGETAETNITKDEVILWTNIERTNLGLPSLKTDETLNLIAQKKLNDLFVRNRSEE